MSQERPTLKDLAKIFGVSTTTIHRALQGKEGVSGETGEAIRRMAAEMGYRANYMAANLKRKTLRLAIAFPEPSQEYEFYYRSLWQGVRQFFQDNQQFSSVEPIEFFYPLSPGAHGVLLQQLYEDHLSRLDGLLTLAVEHPLSALYLEKLSEAGLPIALVGSDLYQEQRLCCVKAFDELAGRLAAELLRSFYPGPLEGKLLLTGNPVGSFPMLDQARNAAGFESYLRKHAPGAVLLTAYHPDVHLAAMHLRALLAEHPDLYAIYSVSARHTVMACQVLEELGLSGQIKLIGNDRFPESIAGLERGTISAVIDKKISHQSYRASQLLFDYVTKADVPSAQVVYVQPSILLPSNANIEPEP